MKRWLAAPTVLALLTATPEIRYFHYQRPIQLPSTSAEQACVALPPALFAEAAPGLTDLRLFRNDAEEPFLIHQATPPRLEQQILPPLNAGSQNGLTVFDSEMPPGRYENVDLSIAAQDFVANITVSGSQTEAGPKTHIGSYTIFDLTRQKLGRGTMLTLPVADYRFLHFSISGPIKADSIQGIRVSSASEEKPRYAEVATTGPGTVRERSTVLTVQVPAHTPVDKVVFFPASSPQFFERPVRIIRKPLNPSPDHPAQEELVADGSLLRIHGIHEGKRIDEERLEISVPGYQADTSSIWMISIDNADDRPLFIQSARLVMVERDLCFHTPPDAGSPVLYYGDQALSSPLYDYAALADVQESPAIAQLGAETANPAWQPRPDARPFTEKHPWLLWVVLCIVIAILSLLTVRTARRRMIAE